MKKITLPKRLMRIDIFVAALCGLIVALGGLWSWNHWVPRWAIPGFDVRGRGIDASGEVTFSPDERDAARRQVRDALAALDTYLGSGANGIGWRSHLRLEELRGQIAGTTDAADRHVLKGVLDRFSESHAGLELPEFVGVRTALSTYLKVLSLPVRSA